MRVVVVAVAPCDFCQCGGEAVDFEVEKRVLVALQAYEVFWGEANEVGECAVELPCAEARLGSHVGHVCRCGVLRGVGDGLPGAAELESIGIAVVQPAQEEAFDGMPAGMVVGGIHNLVLKHSQIPIPEIVKLHHLLEKFA